MNLLLLSTICITIILAPSVRCGAVEVEEQWLNGIFGDNNVRKQDIRPKATENPEFSFFDSPANITGSPVLVTISMHILDVSEVDDTDQDFKVTLYFRQSWNDPRLIHSSSDPSVEHVSVGDTDRMWVPDIFFVNARDGKVHDVTKRNTFVRIHGNGDVLHSTRYTMKLACNMDLSRYPFDKQICGITMESYGFQMSDMVLLWKDDNKTVTIDKMVKPQPFKLEGFGYGYCNAETSHGKYSCLRTELLLARRGGARFILQAYIPLAALVLLSYGLLWCPGHRCKRLALAGVLFVMVSGVSAVTTNFAPRTSDCTALDCLAWWSVLLSALPFIILALAATMDSCRRKAQKRDYESCAEDGNKTMELLTPKFTENGDGATEEPASPAPAVQKKPCVFARVGLTVERFEKAARLFIIVVLGLYFIAHILYYAIDMTCHESLSVEKKFAFPLVDA